MWSVGCIFAGPRSDLASLSLSFACLAAVAVAVGLQCGRGFAASFAQRAKKCGMEGGRDSGKAGLRDACVWRGGARGRAGGMEGWKD
eukprot:2589968-Rhodomonas_salina.1